MGALSGAGAPAGGMGSIGGAMMGPGFTGAGMSGGGGFAQNALGAAGAALGGGGLMPTEPGSPGAMMQNPQLLNMLQQLLGSGQLGGLGGGFGGPTDMGGMNIPIQHQPTPFGPPGAGGMNPLIALMGGAMQGQQKAPPPQLGGGGGAQDIAGALMQSAGGLGGIF